MKRTSLLLSVSLLSLLGQSCVAPQKVQGYEDEIVALREERTRLKKENNSLKQRLGDYEVQLADANMRMIESPAAPAQAAYPELDDLGITYGQRGSDIVFQVPSEVTFGSGKTILSKSGQGALREVATILLREYGTGVFFIEGHTDNDPIKKSKFKSNRELSVARAMEVHSFLVEQCGLPDEQCVVAGYGEYQPVMDNSSKDGKAKNRRVEIIVRAG